jgi:uncharacterized protein with HEPN domain
MARGKACEDSDVEIVWKIVDTHLGTLQQALETLLEQPPRDQALESAVVC